MTYKKTKKPQIEEKKLMPWEDFNKARKDDYELRMKHERENDVYLNNLPDFYTPEATQVISVSDIVANRVVFDTHSDKSLDQLILLYQDRGDEFVSTLETLIHLKRTGRTEKELVENSTKSFFAAIKKMDMEIIS